MNKPFVFISCSYEGLPVAHALSDQLDRFVNCTVWDASVFSLGRTNFESLTEVADRSDFAVFILTPDDITQPRVQTFDASRDNLIFELGFLAGRIGISRIFVLVTGDPPRLRMPSDLTGIVYIPVSLEWSSAQGKEKEKSIAHVANFIIKAINDLKPRAQERAVEYYSCFISYSWDDQSFATRLHDDLTEVGVRCWLDVKDMVAGDSIADQIDRAIQAHDKVVLVLSRASIGSKWVNAEIRNALRLEQARQQTILFPIHIDDAVFEMPDTPESDLVREKYIVNFRDWKDQDSYQRAFSRLVRDLAISASVESGGRN